MSISHFDRFTEACDQYFQDLESGSERVGERRESVLEAAKALQQQNTALDREEVRSLQSMMGRVVEQRGENEVAKAIQQILSSFDLYHSLPVELRKTVLSWMPLRDLQAMASLDRDSGSAESLEQEALWNRRAELMDVDSSDVSSTEELKRIVRESIGEGASPLFEELTQLVTNQVTQGNNLDEDRFLEECGRRVREIIVVIRPEGKANGFTDLNSRIVSALQPIEEMPGCAKLKVAMIAPIFVALKENEAEGLPVTPVEQGYIGWSLFNAYYRSGQSESAFTLMEELATTRAGNTGVAMMAWFCENLKVGAFADVIRMLSVLSTTGAFYSEHPAASEEAPRWQLDESSPIHLAILPFMFAHPDTRREILARIGPDSNSFLQMLDVLKDSEPVDQAEAIEEFFRESDLAFTQDAVVHVYTYWLSSCAQGGVEEIEKRARLFCQALQERHPEFELELDPLLEKVTRRYAQANLFQPGTILNMMGAGTDLAWWNQG